MKAKTFENLIRKIIREEIDYALRREIKSLKEDLRDELKPVIVEQNTPTNSLKEKIMGTKSPLLKKKNIPTQAFTSDSTLNDLLNETAQGDTRLDSMTSPVSMEGDFSTVGGVPVEVAPKAVVEAVNRDYSSLMKAIDKKRNHKP